MVADSFLKNQIRNAYKHIAVYAYLAQITTFHNLHVHIVIHVLISLPVIINQLILCQFLCSQTTILSGQIALFLLLVWTKENKQKNIDRQLSCTVILYKTLCLISSFNTMIHLTHSALYSTLKIELVGIQQLE